MVGGLALIFASGLLMMFAELDNFEKHLPAWRVSFWELERAVRGAVSGFCTQGVY